MLALQAALTAPPSRLTCSRRSVAARARRPLAVSADAAKWKVIKPAQVNDFINDKGYTFMDIRTGKEYRSGNGLHWIHLPVAEEVDGAPVMNPNFKAVFDKKFKNKMSRVIIACDDGGRRSELAAGMVTDLGYTAIAIIEGGIDAYLKSFPLTEKDKKARVARVEQQVGIKYGGTGVTSEQTPDDSA